MGFFSKRSDKPASPPAAMSKAEAARAASPLPPPQAAPPTPTPQTAAPAQPVAAPSPQAPVAPPQPQPAPSPPAEPAAAPALAHNPHAIFGEVIGLLSRSPAFQNAPLAAAAALVAQPVSIGQFAIGRNENGEAVAACLWAMTSDEVDARITAAPDAVQLSPEEWRSGPTPWILVTVGDEQTVRAMLGALQKSLKRLKVRARSPDGTMRALELKEAA